MAYRDLDAGRGRKAVSDNMEVHIKTVDDWIRRRPGIEARNGHGEKRGRAPHEQKVLSRKAEEKVLRILREKTPEKAGFPYSLWTRKSIKLLIERESGVRIVLETVSKYAKRWGLTPQRPGKVAAEQDPEKVEKWLREEYPAIRERAEEENARICWGDETGVSLSAFYGRVYAPMGKTPDIRLPAKHISLSMISAVDNRGGLRFMLYDGGLRVPKFLEFLERMVKGAKQKIFLVVDNLKVHRARAVTEWREKNRDRIELFFPADIQPAAKSG